MTSRRVFSINMTGHSKPEGFNESTLWLQKKAREGKIESPRKNAAASRNTRMSLSKNFSRSQQSREKQGVLPVYLYVYPHPHKHRSMDGIIKCQCNFTEYLKHLKHNIAAVTFGEGSMQHNSQESHELLPSMIFAIKPNTTKLRL